MPQGLMRLGTNVLTSRRCRKKPTPSTGDGALRLQDGPRVAGLSDGLLLSTQPRHGVFPGNAWVPSLEQELLKKKEEKKVN